MYKSWFDEDMWNVQTSMDESKLAAIDRMFESIDAFRGLESFGVNVHLQRAPDVLHQHYEWTLIVRSQTGTFRVPMGPTTLSNWSFRMEQIRVAIIEGDVQN